MLYNNGFLDIAESTTIGVETLTRTLEAGEYVIEVYEWSHLDPTYSAADRAAIRVSMFGHGLTQPQGIQR